jgi:hypothetical protein
MKVDKARAIALRESGRSYASIAMILKCSEAWCKLYLKDVVKGEREEPDAEVVRQKIIEIMEEAMTKIREL